MAIGPVRSGAVGESLSNLQRLQRESEKNSRELSSRKKVEKAEDDAEVFFRARQLVNRATDATERASNLDQQVSKVETALVATETISDLQNQLKGIAAAAASETDQGNLDELASQFNEVAKQIDAVARDASFGGTNLVNGGNQKSSVQLGPNSNSELTVDAEDLSTTNTGIPTNVTGAQLGNQASREAITQAVDSAASQTRAAEQKLASSVSVSQTRQDFEKEASRIQQEGADKQTDADLNEAAARQVAVQTRTQISTRGLAASGDFERNILSLF